MVEAEQEPHDFTIRVASGADLDTLNRFQQGIVAAERPFDPLLCDTGVQYYDIATMLMAPEVRLLVAEHDARVIGCAFARIEAAKPWLRHAHEAYMGLMFVEPAWRGRGVNAGLLCELQAWCRGRGIREVRLDVYADNIAAVSAYRKAGFRVNLLEMRMTLDDGSGRAGQ